MYFSRENTVTCVAALMLAFTSWAWGGVVLWAQWVVLGLGGLSLALALAPERRTAFVDKRPSGSLRLALALGLLLAAGFVSWDLYRVHAEREATLALVPGATLAPLGFAQWGLRGALAGPGATLAVLIFAGLLRGSDARRRILRFPLFWIGLVLFAWVACQALNPWGLVVHRDLIWKIVPQEHISWLPSGVDAPFDSTEEPGGMNGWRQILILAGPWMLLCALRAAVLRRRCYAWLSSLAVLNGLAVAVVGNIARAEKWDGFLGFAVSEIKQPFGPFFYRNHGGAWLYLVLVLALALMFHLAKRRGDRVDRGGPHLLVAGAAVLLALGAASTMSFGSLAAAALLLLLVAPASYLLDVQLRRNLSPVPAIATVAMAAVVAYVGLLSADAQRWRWKLEKKQATMERIGENDRAPLHRVTWAMVATPPLARAVSGWGGGSFRWVSPGYMAKEPIYLDNKGKLVRRASFAHNDWLQALAEWGAAGWVAVILALGFLLTRLARAWRRPAASSLAILGGLLVLAVHAWYDFLLFQPQLVLLAVAVAWLMVLEHGDSEHAL
jgi:hypothetical protein